MEWTERTSGTTRTLSCQRPSGYQARIEVDRGVLKARLWKPPEARDTFDLAPRALGAQEIDAAVEGLKADLEARLRTLEDGHS